MLKLASFLQRDPTEPNVLDTKEIDDVMDAIGVQLESALAHKQAGKSSVVLEHVVSGDFISLVRSLMASETKLTDMKSWLKMVVAKFGIESLVRTLLMVSLKDWVFETDFPNFTSGNQQLLQAYRNVVIDYGAYLCNGSTSGQQN
jgi:hypothetical protein